MAELVTVRVWMVTSCKDAAFVEARAVAISGTSPGPQES
jgi:hypothetical protein